MRIADLLEPQHRCSPTNSPASAAGRSGRRWSSADRRAAPGGGRPAEREAIAFTCAVRGISARRARGDVAARESLRRQGRRAARRSGARSAGRPKEGQRPTAEKISTSARRTKTPVSISSFDGQPQVAPIAAILLSPFRHAEPRPMLGHVNRRASFLLSRTQHASSPLSALTDLQEVLAPCAERELEGAHSMIAGSGAFVDLREGRIGEIRADMALTPSPCEMASDHIWTSSPAWAPTIAGAEDDTIARPSATLT